MVQMDINLLLVLGILLLALAIGITSLMRRSRSRRLAERFGPEYERALQRTGHRGKAEAELAARERRVRKLQIVPLPAEEAQRFRLAWQALQTRFVDDPRGSVAEADLLVRDVMARRGYPMADFETQAADISVDHPVVVTHYRAAHDIAARDRQAPGDTEALRQALVHYRALFAELLEVAEQPVADRVVEERRVRQPLRPPVMQPERALARDEAAARERDRREGERDGGRERRTER